MTPTRRAVLAGLAAAACSPREATRPSRPPVTGALRGTELLRAHAGGPESPRLPPRASVDVVIVGAGIAGLVAGWRIERSGYPGTVVVLELGAAPGGTAVSGSGPNGPYPWGAHYLTLPAREAGYLRALLEDLGVIVGFDGAGAPLYDPMALCFAPEERTWVEGVWVEGLWPTGRTTAEDEASLVAFTERVAEWHARVGRDGRPAFALPVARCSRDPDIRALATRSFAEWLDAERLGGAAFRAWVEYACRDDFGTRLHETSAWAGLHYFASRRPWAGDARDLGTEVLTWPAGNGLLVERLRARQADAVRTGCVVTAVTPDGEVWGEADDGPIALRASQVILAVPTRMANRLAGLARPHPDSTPWRVAQLHVDRLPRGIGVPAAWDSVVWGSEALGYVTNTHQLGTADGPAVLTWYEALVGDPVERRTALRAATWEDGLARVRADLARSHPDLDEVLSAVDVWHWGHGTTRPAVGLHAGDALDALARPVGRLRFAHTDLSGMSLFEEAAWHGVRAAEEALDALGHPLAERLAVA